jgi:hypothetical protein
LVPSTTITQHVEQILLPFWIAYFLCWWELILQLQMWRNVHFVQSELTFPSVYVIKCQPYNAISLVSVCKVKNTACGKSLFPHSEVNREIPILKLWVQKIVYKTRWKVSIVCSWDSAHRTSRFSLARYHLLSSLVM